MTYVDPLDPTTPNDLSPAGQGDDRLREAKAAIRERLSTVFADLDADPLKFIAGIIPTAALADLGIATAKIADRAVTGIKIALAGILTENLADAAVTNPKVADGTLTAAKLVGGSSSVKVGAVASGTYVVGSGGLLVLGTGTTDIDINVPGVLVGKQVVATYSGVPDPALIWVAYPNGTGIIRVRIRNLTSSNVTIPAGHGFVATLIDTIG